MEERKKGRKKEENHAHAKKEKRKRLPYLTERRFLRPRSWTIQKKKKKKGRASFSLAAGKEGKKGREEISGNICGRL